MSLLESPTAKFEERNQLTHIYSDPISAVSNSSSVSDNFTILLNQAKQKKAIHKEAKTIQQELLNERKIHDQEKEEILHKLEQVMAEKNSLYSFINSLLDILNIPKLESSNELETASSMNPQYDFNSILAKIEKIVREYKHLKKIKKKLLNETSSQNIDEAINDIVQIKKQGEIISGFSDLKRILNGQSELIQAVLSRIPKNDQPLNNYSSDNYQKHRSKSNAITSPIINKEFDYSGNDYSDHHKFNHHNQFQTEEFNGEFNDNSRNCSRSNQRQFDDSRMKYDSNGQVRIRDRSNTSNERQANYQQNNRDQNKEYEYNNQQLGRSKSFDEKRVRYNDYENNSNQNQQYSERQMSYNDKQSNSYNVRQNDINQNSSIEPGDQRRNYSNEQRHDYQTRQYDNERQNSFNDNQRQSSKYESHSNLDDMKYDNQHKNDEHNKEMYSPSNCNEQRNPYESNATQRDKSPTQPINKPQDNNPQNDKQYSNSNFAKNSNEDEIDSERQNSEKSFNPDKIKSDDANKSTCSEMFEKNEKRRKKKCHQSNEQNVLFEKNYTTNYHRRFNIAHEVDNTTTSEDINGYNDMRETIWMTKTKDMLSLERQLIKRTKQLNKAKKKQCLLQTNFQKELSLNPVTMF